MERYKQANCNNCEYYVDGYLRGTKCCKMKERCSIGNPKDAITCYYSPLPKVKDEIIEALQNVSDFHTDSDLLDFAEQHNFAPVDVEIVFAEKKAFGTNCEGCAHVASLFSCNPGCPCNNCSRRCVDMFENKEKLLESCKKPFIKHYI